MAYKIRRFIHSNSSMSEAGMEAKKDFYVELEDFNDGHAPGGTTVPTRMAYYRNKQSTNFLSVFDNVMPEEWCTRAYDFGVEKGKPWGAYVTTEDALKSTVTAEELWQNKEYEKAIALMAVRSLIVEKGKVFIGKDFDNIHGTAVWCLVSSQDDEVKYHIDYAELYRYETNIIYPPVYAGTCQVAPVRNEQDMIGGAFKANTAGTTHYQRFGYKCRLASKEEFDSDQHASDWITINYKHNRGIFHDGNFPHHATPINFIRPGLHRVILGFNCFTKEVGESNLRAPEHSDAFNRTIKLYQKMAALGVPITSAPPQDLAQSTTEASLETEEKRTEEGVESQTQKKKSGGGISVKEIMKNPTLAKLLVKAAKNVRQSQAANEAKEANNKL